ncbi:MAG TPA: acyl-CoA dehydrogenase family protein [Acidimicrobiia bacterium]|nr:acyl-CoA dehydrogenase family protein [Acidimicrobiia bacterium]
MSSDLSALSADELRDRTCGWLTEHLPSGWMEAIDAGDADRMATLRAGIDYAAWCSAFGDSGFATPTWPAEYGAGLSLAPGQARAVNEVLNHYRVPRPGNIIGIGMGGPTVIAWGSEDLKQQFLRGIATNEEIWCQLFSEPGAGSDVAGLATRAERDGDEWVVNGQKVWTSLAHLARYGMLLARTDPDQPKHKGLSYFVIDMHQPGVEVRPLRQITGDAEFNEVFFANARVPDEWRLGPVGEGWRVAITTLMNERVSLSGPGSVSGDTIGGSPVQRVVDRSAPMRDPRLRQRLVAAWIDHRVIALNNQRAADRRRIGAEPGPEGSITKLQSAEFNQRLQKLAVDLEGVSGIAWEGEGLSGESTLSFVAGAGGGTDDPRTVARGFLRSQANTIEGGTSSIMRNILGERVLGLPKEPDSSRDVPWKDVLRSV